MLDYETEEAKDLRKIKETLAKHSRWAEYGAVVKIDGTGLMEEEETCKMRTPFLYGIVSNLEHVCDLTNSHAYQTEWAINHVDTGNSFLLCFAAPYFEHVFEVVRFKDEEDEK